MTPVGDHVRTWAEVDLEAIRHNIGVVRALRRAPAAPRRSAPHVQNPCAGPLPNHWLFWRPRKRGMLSALLSSPSASSSPTRPPPRERFAMRSKRVLPGGLRGASPEGSDPGPGCARPKRGCMTGISRPMEARAMPRPKSLLAGSARRNSPAKPWRPRRCRASMRSARRSM